MAEDKGQQDKIKELEESLARELDQQVNLSVPTDSRIQGTVELNPTLNLSKEEPKEKQAAEQPMPDVAAAPVPTYEPTAKSRPPEEAPVGHVETKVAPQEEAGEVSLEDLDKILSQEMPDLEHELKALREAGEDPAVKSADLSGFDVDENVEPSPPDTEPEKKLSFKELITAKIKRAFNWMMEALYQLPIKGYKYSVKFIKEDAKNILAALFYKLNNGYSRARGWYRDQSIWQKLALLALAVIPAVIIATLLGKIPGIQLGKIEIHEGFAIGADEEYKYETHNPFVPLSEEGQYPEHVVLITRVVVNVKPSESSGPNPMVAVRLYYELSTREGAVELKDREKEVRDLTQRVLETFDYDQIVSIEGKTTFKEALRREVSSILNNGVVKSIFIDDILIKP